MYIVMRIGCIECGVSSAILSAHATQKAAKEAAAVLDEDPGTWYEGGQCSYEVFLVPEITVNEHQPNH